MIVLGIDPSLRNFGWVRYHALGVGPQKVLAKGRLHTTQDCFFIERYVYLREALRAVVRSGFQDKIGIEYPIFHDTWSEGMFGLFLFCCEAIFAERQDVVFLSNTSTKAHAREFLGRKKGWKMSKSDMMEASRRDCGISQWSGDEADAYWVARSASRFWMLRKGLITENDLMPSERKTFCLKQTVSKNQGQGILGRRNDRFFLWSDIEKMEGTT